MKWPCNGCIAKIRLSSNVSIAIVSIELKDIAYANLQLGRVFNAIFTTRGPIIYHAGVCFRINISICYTTGSSKKHET